MKSILYLIVFLIFFLCQSNTVFAKSWIEFVRNDVVHLEDFDRIREVYLAEQVSFKKLLVQWENEENKTKQIELFTEYGIPENIATRAVEERLKLARKLVKSNFMERIDNISPGFDALVNRIFVMDTLIQLGHDRFQKVMKKNDITVGDGFYQCLCNSYSIGGTGIRYSPPPDKHCENNNPCKGGNNGCVSHNLPREGKVWAECAQKIKTSEGVNILRAMDKHINIIAKVGPKKWSEILVKKQKQYEEDCLPVFSQQFQKALEDGTRVAVTREAITISEKADDRCEEAVALSLFTNSQSGRIPSEIFIDLLKPWIVPDQYVALEALTGLPAVASTINNLNSNKELLFKELKDHSTNEVFHDAYTLFVDSKKMSHAELKSSEEKLQTAIYRTTDELEKIDDDYQNADDADRVKTRAIYGAQMINHTKTAWINFDHRQEKRIKAARRERAKVLFERTKLLLQRDVLTEYRIPFSEIGCQKYLAENERACKEKKDRQALLDKKQQQKIRQDALKRAAEIDPVGNQRTNPTPGILVIPQK